MQKEYEVVIADTSCLILLEKIGELDLLRLIFGRVTITNEIAREFGSDLADWFTVRWVKNANLQHDFDLDPGETSAIALALELDSVLVILDDYKARKVAQRMGLEISGTLGVVLKAKRLNIIDSVRPLLEKIQLTNFRYSQKVFDQILSLAGE
jgi:predicted nucleic acid-binding protein